MAVGDRIKLGAGNGILRNMGVSPVNSLTGSSNLNVQNAVAELLNTSRNVQRKGWKFNTIDTYTIQPTLDNELLVPKNALVAKPITSSTIVARGTRFYDTENNTYVISESLDVTLVEFLEWEELPEVARQYIKVRAARILQQDTVSSQTLSSYDEKDEAEALLELRVEEEIQQGANVLNSQTAQRITTRNRVTR